MHDNAYYGHDQSAFHRYSTRGTGYGLRDERDHPSSTMHPSYDRHLQYTLSHGAHQEETPPDQDPNVKPRSRIPVACQRCRKRKIRCSGDNGDACSNCQNAGAVEQCQFLRVASENIPFHVDTGVLPYSDYASPISKYPNGMDVSSSPYAQLQQNVMPMYYDPYQFRHPPLPAYQQVYTHRSLYENSSSFNGFDSQLGYAVEPPSHLTMGDSSSHAGVPHGSQPVYAATGSGHVWEPVATTTTKDEHIFNIDHRPAYKQNDVAYGNNQTCSVRASPYSKPSIRSTENGSILALPTPAFGSDRILPFPAAHRLAVDGVSLRQGNTIATPSTGALQPLHDPDQFSDSAPTNTTSSTATSEGSYSARSSSQSPDSLTHISRVEHGNSIIRGQVMPTSSDRDSYGKFYDFGSSYTHCSSNVDFGKELGGTKSSDTRSTTKFDDDFASGHQYTPPYHSGAASYPTPPMSIQSVPTITEQRKNSIQVQQR